MIASVFIGIIPAMIHSSEAILAVADVTETVRFYRDVLGFESEWFWGTPPTFGGVHWGRLQVMFCQQPELAKRVEGHMHFFRVENVRAMYDKHRAIGAPIVGEIENKPWGLCEYVVRDPNGYHLRFAGAQEYVPKPTATQTLPAHIRIEMRTPSVEDYHRLILSVGWNCREPELLAGSLARSVLCIVAVDQREQKTVGMLRVVGDGRFYTIWDVMVKPAHQQQRIGTAMMERAIQELQKIGPKGAFVGLFTHKHGFYEHIGFNREMAMHRML